MDSDHHAQQHVYIYPHRDLYQRPNRYPQFHGDINAYTHAYRYVHEYSDRDSHQ
jgi:hypothetical protein